jgi:WD40 repeat protein
MLLTASNDHTARVWNRQGQCLQILTGHTGRLTHCSFSADNQKAITASSTEIRHWRQSTQGWACTLELHPATQTRIWLDQQTQTLQLDGPDWPSWQLQSSGTTENGPDSAPKYLLGETIAEWGPMAHEQLANAEDWRFLPRDDIQVKSGL